ncbi:MAG: substrate-binding domain-containing protein [Planctomycetales bacterium]|nr:substrate-binding domain-containing protein [Planctomycetales bacterium]
MQLPLRLPLVYLSLALLLAGIACTPSSPSPGPRGGGDQPSETAKLRIAMIPKGTQASFWTSVHNGAKRAAEEFDVELIWKGPPEDNDRAGQIETVQQFISERVDGIALAPLDSKALVGPVKSAGEQNIPVVIFDSALDEEASTAGEDYVSFAATNNLQGGKLGGEELAKLAGGDGKVVVFRHQVGHASTTKREEGALQALNAANIEIISDNQYGGPDTSSSMEKAEAMVDTIKQADGIFASNQNASEGMLRALQRLDLAGKVKFVGFDSSPLLVRGLEQGEVDALVVQNPDLMGYTAVKLLAEHLRGQEVPPEVDTGVAVATQENMNDAQIAPLLK